MKIYSTRHGQTEFNRRDIILGTTDIELNEKGREQAEELAERAAALGDIDVIIASPMKRAMQTAQMTARRLGMEIITDERLREWDYGEYEQMPRFTDGFAWNKENFGVRMGKTGESLLQLSHRVFSAVDDIIEKYRGKNVLIVSHGGVCRVIEMYFNDMTTEKFSGWFMENCQIIEYDITEQE